MSVTRTQIFSAVGVLTTAAIFAACGSDPESSSPNGAGGGPGAGGSATGAGGSATGAGGASTGGPLSPENAVITGTITQCPGTMPAPLPNMTVPECVAAGCSNAACIPANLLTQFAPSAPTDLLASCAGDPNQLCVPLDFVATTGDFLAKTCTSVAGSEGRYLSTCIPQVTERMDQLPQADCAPAERCAPCFDPTKDGADTQACNQGCDTGPTQPAVTFQECGEGLGMCVPQELVPADLSANVPVADCTEPGFVCAPKTHVADINHQFTLCEPTSDLLQAVPANPGPNGEKGGCVPKYLVDNIEPAPPPDAVLQDTCPAGFLCAPCSNPLADQAPTGACPLP